MARVAEHVGGVVARGAAKAKALGHDVTQRAERRTVHALVGRSLEDALAFAEGAGRGTLAEWTEPVSVQQASVVQTGWTFRVCESSGELAFARAPLAPELVVFYILASVARQTFGCFVGKGHALYGSDTFAPDTGKHGHCALLAEHTRTQISRFSAVLDSIHTHTEYTYKKRTR